MKHVSFLLSVVCLVAGSSLLGSGRAHAEQADWRDTRIPEGMSAEQAQALVGKTVLLVRDDSSTIIGLVKEAGDAGITLEAEGALVLVAYGDIANITLFSGAPIELEPAPQSE